MSLLSGIVGAVFNKKAAKKGAKQQYGLYQGAETNALNALGGARDATLGYQQPYSDVGVNALGRAAQMQTPGFQYSPSDPSYAWRLSQGVNAIDRSAAARGSMGSGGTLKALTQYGQGLGSTEFQADFNRDNQLASYGQHAADQMGQAQQNYGANAANALFWGARGKSGAISDRTAANQQFIGNLQGSWDSAENTISKFFGF